MAGPAASRWSRASAVRTAPCTAPGRSQRRRALAEQGTVGHSPSKVQREVLAVFGLPQPTQEGRQIAEAACDPGAISDRAGPKRDLQSFAERIGGGGRAVR